MKNISELKLSHFFYLLSISILAIILRFYHLDSKTLWIDEVITALISLGNSYDNLPLNTLLKPDQIINIFQFKNDNSCHLIIENLTYQSTHPPLFFCLLNIWLGKLQKSDINLLWQLRILPAFFGVITVYLIYLLNRYLFSRKNALFASALMAVSPLGIYLAQEARHYTIAMVLILLGLILLVRNIDDLEKGKISLKMWLMWSIVMGLSFYAHYYCLLAYFSQVFSFLLYLFIRGKYWQITLRYAQKYFSFLSNNLLINKLCQPFILIFAKFKRITITKESIQIKQKQLIIITINFLLPLVLFSPWFSILLTHVQSDKTSWLPNPSLISPFYQTVMAWILMLVSFPVEHPFLPVQILSGLVMLIFVIYVGKIIGDKWFDTWKKYPQLLILFSYVLFCVFSLIILSYLFDKDLTIVPRYSFFYYPAFISLVAIFIYPNISKKNNDNYPRQSFDKKQNNYQQRLLILIIGLISCVCVLQNLVFKKPYEPTIIAQQFNQSSEKTMVILNYRDTNEIAFSLSYAYALSNLPSVNPTTEIGIFDYSQGYERVWNQLSQLDAQPSLLWIVAPGLVFKSYPPQIVFANLVECTIDPDEYYRLGFPRQLYRCHQQ